ncbi:hypothetical protein D3C76_1135490 [compost metagenome]
MQQAGWVQRLAGFRHRANVAAIAGFVAERPDDNRRMVFLRLHVAHDALDIHAFPRWIVGDAAQIADVGKSVGFDVSFRHHEQTVQIAQLVKARIVRIVGGAYRVDVVLLHQDQIFLDAIHTHRAPLAMIVIVAVHAVEHHVMVVDEHQAVAHLDVAEAHALRHHFQYFARRVFQDQ